MKFKEVGKPTLKMPHPQKFVIEDLTGWKSGKLVALRCLGVVRHGKANVALWLCRCECGRFENKTSDQLKKFRTKSCKACSKIRGNYD